MAKITLEFWESLRNKQTYLRILVWFVVVSLGLMTASTFIVHYSYSRNAIKEIGANAQTLLEEKAATTSFLLEWLISASFGYSQDPDIYRFAIQKYDEPMIRNYDVVKKIESLKNGNPFIESIYIINPTTNRIASSITVVSPAEQFFDTGIFEYAKQWDPKQFYRLEPRLIDTKLSGKPYKKLVLTLIIPYLVQNTLSAFIVNIDASRLYGFFMKINHTEEQIYLLDAGNHILAGADETQFMSVLEGVPLQQTEPEWRRIGASAKKSLLVERELSLLGWRLVQVVPSEKLMASFNQTRNYMFVAVFALGVLSLIGIFLLSGRLYSPIASLVKAVQGYKLKPPGDPESHRGGNDGGDISFLTRVMQWQNLQLQKAAQKLKNNLAFSKESFLKELIAPASLPEKDRLKLFAEFDLVIRTESLAVAVFQLDGFSAFLRDNSPEQQQLLRYAMRNIITETMSFQVETVEWKPDVIVMLGNIPQDSDEWLISYLQLCQKNIAAYLHLSTTAALGPAAEDCTMLPYSFKAALELSRERFKYGSGSLVSEDLIQHPGQPYSYPDQIEKRIAEALKLGHKDEAARQFGQFVRTVKPYPSTNIHLALTQFLVRISQSFQRMKVITDALPDASLSDIHRMLETMETLDAAEQWIVGMIDQIVEEQAEQRSGRTVKIVQEIKEIVEANVHDVNLSIKLIADRLGLSVNYVRNLFKTHSDLSLPDYIKTKQLDKATELLIRTKQPIEDICYQCGFAAINSFYIAFKKKYGVTPAQYRKEHEALRQIKRA